MTKCPQIYACNKNIVKPFSLFDRKKTMKTNKKLSDQLSTKAIKIHKYK